MLDPDQGSYDHLQLCFSNLGDTIYHSFPEETLSKNYIPITGKPITSEKKLAITTVDIQTLSKSYSYHLPFPWMARPPYASDLVLGLATTAKNEGRIILAPAREKRENAQGKRIT